MNSAAVVLGIAADTKHLTSVFEQSLAVLCEGPHKNGKTVALAPRRRSALPLHVDPAHAQKRALDDAASALAALWKIQESGQSKMKPRIQRSSR